MFFPSIDAMTDILGGFLATADGRGQLIRSYSETARASLPEVDLAGGAYVCSSQVQMIEAVLTKCDGTEQFDRIMVQGLLGDLKGAIHGKSLTPDPAVPDEVEATALMTGLVTFIRDYKVPEAKEPGDLQAAFADLSERLDSVVTIVR